MATMHLGSLRATLHRLRTAANTRQTDSTGSDQPASRLVAAVRWLLAVTNHARVRSHLFRAERRLRWRTGADPERVTLLDRLRAYRRGGEFPRNTRTAGRTPVFRDDDGRLCAMADLAAATGHEDVVDTVAERDNLADLERDPVPDPLAAWLSDHPIEADEAALVQPSYGGGGFIIERACRPIACWQVKTLVVSWAFATLFLVEGVVYLLLDRFDIGETMLRRGAILAVTGLVAAVLVAAVALLVGTNVAGTAEAVGTMPM